MGPEVARQLRREVENGEDDIRARTVHEVRQAAAREASQRNAAGAAAGAPAQEGAVQAGICPWEVPDRALIEAAQAGAKTVRQEGEDIDDVRLVAVLPCAPREFPRDGVVTGSH